jgi:hypothetical protein
MGWTVNVGGVSLTRKGAAELVAEPVLLLTKQRNWSPSMPGVAATVRVFVELPL